MDKLVLKFKRQQREEKKAKKPKGKTKLPYIHNVMDRIGKLLEQQNILAINRALSPPRTRETPFQHWA